MKLQKHWVWGGLALAIVAILSIVLVKPLGVSTQYVITGGMVLDAR